MPALLRAFAFGYCQRCCHNHPWTAEYVHPERVHWSPIRRQKPGRGLAQRPGGASSLLWPKPVVALRVTLMRVYPLVYSPLKTMSV